jgi:hypothetical protein
MSIEKFDPEGRERQTHLMRQVLKEQLENDEISGDLSGIGNEIGVLFGRLINDLYPKGLDQFEKDDFISGFEHGWSLTDDTH